jgi:hypothetical protein
MFTTANIKSTIAAITAAGCLEDAERSAKTFDFGGLKFIVRAAISWVDGVDVPQDDIRLGFLCDLATALGAVA